VCSGIDTVDTCRWKGVCSRRYFGGVTEAARHRLLEQSSYTRTQQDRVAVDRQKGQLLIGSETVEG
jgi:hypothetical protein